MNILDQYDYSVSKGFAASITTNPTYSILSKYFHGVSCLEIGCADGGGTKILLKHFKKVTAVDGSSIMLKKLRKNIHSKKLSVVYSYFESLELKDKFDTIIMCHVLEHVENPTKVLKIAKALLKNNGVIIINVPNALSIHRQAGVLLGMLKNEYTLNDADLSVGHKRVYDMKKLKQDIKKSGLKTVKTGGFLIKAFANNQLEKIFKNNLEKIDGYVKLGERYPDIAAEIYAICSL